MKKRMGKALSVIVTLILISVASAADFNADLPSFDSSKQIEIAFGGNKPCSVALQFRADSYPDRSAGEWSDVSPMTLFRMEGNSPDGYTLFLRIIEEKVTVSYFKKDSPKNFTLTTDYPVAPSEWIHVVLTSSGSGMKLYLNARLYDCRWCRTFTEFTKMRIGADAPGRRRCFNGVFKDEFLFYDKELSADEVNELYRKSTPEDIRRQSEEKRVAFERDRPVKDEPRYRALRVVPEEVHPLVEQLGVRSAVVPWGDANGRDLLLAGGGNFGSRLALHPFVKMHAGLPVYGPGRTITALPLAHYRVVPNRSGTFDLLTYGNKTVYGGQSIVQYLNVGKAGLPDFNIRQVMFEDKPFALSGSGVSEWSLTDVNGDGTVDFLYVKLLPTGADMAFPFVGNPWTGVDVPYAGAGKGYDIRGNWLGSEAIAEYYWRPGRFEKDGALNFGRQHQIMSTGEYPLIWKTIKSRRASTVLELKGERWLLLAGNVDEVMALRITCRDNEVYCGKACPLLKTGYVIPHTYIPSNILTVDLDCDGFDEVLMDGPGGVTAVMRGRKIGEFESVGVAQIQGGYLAGESLTSPCRFDWDEDGKPDILTGDASGHVMLWSGTGDPWRYHSPVPFTVDGAPYKPVAGMTGSIQGPNEKRWGYTKVDVGIWNGRKAMVVNDITGEMVLFYPDKGKAALQSPVPFMKDGEPYKVAWRSRSAIINKSTGFAGVPHDSLLVQDWDGDLSVAIPDMPGSNKIVKEVKLHYTDGETIRLCGPAGLWGRGAITLFDWDCDGKLDIIFGTNRSCQKFFYEKLSRKGTRPYYIRNEGTNEKPVFARPKPFALKNGTELQFGVHNATTWITDLNGDGKADMLIGAEDGKVYGFLNKELIVEE